MALNPASPLKLVSLALLTWVGMSVSVNGQSGDSSLLLTTEVVVKTGDPTELEGIDFNFIDSMEFLSSDKLVFYASTNAPVPNFSVIPEGSGFYYYDLEGDLGPSSITRTEDLAPGVESNGAGFVFSNVPNGSWDMSESGFLFYNATLKRAGVIGSLNQPILYSQDLLEGNPERLINLKGMGHGTDDGSITISNIATGEEIGGYFNPAVFNTLIGVTGFDRAVMFNEFGGGVPNGGSGQISEVKRGVFFRTTEGVWHAVFRVGDQAPGFEAGVTVDGVSFATSRNTTDIIVTTSLSNGVTAFWRLDEFDNSLALIASNDEPAPGFSGRDWSPGAPLLGFADEVAFHGKATANGETDIDAIWLEVDDDGETTLDAIFEASEDGSIFYQTTEGSVTFLSLSEPLVGPDNQFYFFATGRDESDVFVSGIWKLKLDANNDPESIDLLAATNSEAPGQSIDTGALLFQDFRLWEVNIKGDLVFSATLFRNSTTLGSLWLSAAEGNLLAVAAEGDSFGSGDEAVTLDEFYFNQYAGTLDARSVILSNAGTVAFLGLTLDGDDVGTARDTALFRSEVSLPKYIWSGKANTDLWWDITGEATNWDNDAGENWSAAPGSQGTESVEIGALASVRLDSAPANIGSLKNQGALAVTRPLTIQFGAEIERMTLDADLVAHGEVKLAGEDNRWISGAMSGDRGATVEFGGVFSIAPRNSDAIALQTTLSALGKVVHENELVTLEESGVDQEGYIQIGLLGEYELVGGAITDLTGGAGKISNDGVFRKTGTGLGSVNATYESTLGKISVEGGTLQLTGEVDFKVAGNQINVSGNSVLEIGSAATSSEKIMVGGNVSSSGAGTLRLAHGVALEIGNEAEAIFGLTGFDGEGLEIADATVSGAGMFEIGETGRAVFRNVTFDKLGAGLMNRGTLLVGDEETTADASALILTQTLFTNEGLLDINRNIDISPATLGGTALQNNGSINIDGARRIFNGQDTVPFQLVNAIGGRIDKTGMGVAEIDAAFINRGQIDIQEGGFKLTGRFENASTVPFSRFQKTSTDAATFGGDVINNGEFENTGGDLTVEGGFDNISANSKFIFDGGGSATINGQFRHINGAFELRSGTMTLAGSTVFGGLDSPPNLEVKLGTASMNATLVLGVSGESTTHTISAPTSLVGGLGGDSLLELHSGLKLNISGSQDKLEIFNVRTVWSAGDIEGPTAEKANIVLGTGISIGDQLQPISSLNMRRIELLASGGVGLRSSLQSTDLILTDSSITIPVFGHYSFTVVGADIRNGGGANKFIIRKEGVLNAKTGGEHVIEPVFTNSGIVDVDSATKLTVTNVAPETLNSNTLHDGDWIVGMDSTITLVPQDNDQRIFAIGSQASVELKGEGPDMGPNKAGRINNLPTIVGDFNNAGTLILSDINFDVTGGFINTGLINLKNGGISTGDPVDISGEGKLTGNGFLSGRVIQNGVFRPGESPGTITINGDYTQTSTGILEIELGGLEAGTDFDQLIVNGTANLGGTLTLRSTTDTFPVNGTKLSPIVATAITGQFENIISNIPSGRKFFELSITETGVDAEAVVLDVGTFTAWQAGVFTAEEQADVDISGLLADPDKDGVVNLLEYAMDGNPRIYTHSPVTVEFGFNAEGIPESITADFPWANGMTDVAYDLEYSIDLVEWISLNAALENSEDAGVVSLITLSSDLDMQSDAPLFVRFVVSRT